MYKYNFKTKEVKHIFDDIKYIVNNSNIELNCSPKEAVVIELFNKLFVGIPANMLEEVFIEKVNTETTGYLRIEKRIVGYSIHNSILYLRKNDTLSSKYKKNKIDEDLNMILRLRTKSYGLSEEFYNELKNKIK
jgi:hypothetical protein